MTILICVGSSCHLSGSHDVIELFRKAISDNGLSDKVVLKATFCLGKCGRNGVNAKIDDEIVTGRTQNNFNEVFNKYVLSRVK
jgi:NADH:ubiquinone oxidoreductase subunit E